MRKPALTPFRSLLLLLGCGALLVAACSLPGDKAMRDQAAGVSNQVYQALQKRDYGAAARLYSGKFYEKIQPDAWALVLSNVQKKFGAYQGSRLESWKVQRGFSTRSPTMTILVYRVQYEDNYTIDKLTFLTYPDRSEMELVGHSIDYPEN